MVVVDAVEGKCQPRKEDVCPRAPVWHDWEIAFYCLSVHGCTKAGDRVESIFGREVMGSEVADCVVTRACVLRALAVIVAGETMLEDRQLVYY